jgi:hypothetical protein
MVVTEEMVALGQQELEERAVLVQRVVREELHSLVELQEI